MNKCQYCTSQEDISNKIYEDGSKYSDYIVKVLIQKTLYGECLVVSPVVYHNGEREQYMRHCFTINYCPMCGRNLNKKNRKEYLNQKAKEWYRKHKNPNPKEYVHRTEEEKKAMHRQEQKKHYKKHSETIKEKRMERYYNHEIIKNIKKNKQEIIFGKVCYHITEKTANKLINDYSIIGCNNKLYITGI